MGKKAFSFLLWIIGVVLLPAILQSCDKLYKENMDDCYNGITVVLQVDPDTYKAEDAEAAVEHAVLYVFDAGGHFLERRETQVGKEERLWYPDAGKISVAGWLNKQSEFYDITQFGSNITRDDGRVNLIMNRSTAECIIPTDLFYGDEEFKNENSVSANEYKELYASRKVGSMTITVRGLQEYASKFDHNYSVVVGTTSHALDFWGNYGECVATHIPPTAFNSSNELIATNFNIMPTQRESLKISIYHDDAGLVYETNVDKDGKPISIVADHTENVLIDLRVGISVTIERTMWGVAYPWKIYN